MLALFIWAASPRAHIGEVGFVNSHSIILATLERGAMFGTDYKSHKILSFGCCGLLQQSKKLLNKISIQQSIFDLIRVLVATKQ
jgi:hypothetical protein